MPGVPGGTPPAAAGPPRPPLTSLDLLELDAAAGGQLYHHSGVQRNPGFRYICRVGTAARPHRESSSRRSRVVGVARPRPAECLRAPQASVRQHRDRFRRPWRAGGASADALPDLQKTAIYYKNDENTRILQAGLRFPHISRLYRWWLISNCDKYLDTIGK